MNLERVSPTKPPLIAGLRHDRAPRPARAWLANMTAKLAGSCISAGVGLFRFRGAHDGESSNPSESNPWRPVGMGASLKDKPFVFAASNWVRSAKMSAALTDRLQRVLLGPGVSIILGKADAQTGMLRRVRIPYRLDGYHPSEAKMERCRGHSHAYRLVVVYRKERRDALG
jgi:hypothetical protein